MKYSTTQKWLLKIDEYHAYIIEVGNGSPLQYSCLENSMNRGAL